MLQNVLKGKFLVRNAYIKKIEISQIHNLTLYLKKLEKEETKPKAEGTKKNQSRNKSNRNQKNNRNKSTKLRAGFSKR